MKNREEYIDKLASQLKEWSGKIDELEAKARAAKAEAETGYEQQVAQLKEKRDAARKKLEELQSSSSDAWEILKTGADTAWTELKNSVAAAKDTFK